MLGTLNTAGASAATVLRAPQARRLTPLSGNYYVSLCRLFRWAEDEGFMGDSPMANIKLRRPEKKVIEPYTREELKALVRVCQHDINNGSPFPGTRNKAIILVFLDSGIRLSELANIRLDDIDLDSGVIKVTGKGSKQRLVGIAKTTKVALWKYKTWRPDGSPWLWLGEEGHRLTARAIQSMFKRLKDRAGLARYGRSSPQDETHHGHELP